MSQLLLRPRTLGTNAQGGEALPQPVGRQTLERYLGIQSNRLFSLGGYTEEGTLFAVGGRIAR